MCQVRLQLDQWFWRRVFKVFNVFLLFHSYLPFEKRVTLHLIKKLELSSPKDALCQVWLKLDQWFWRRFLKFVDLFLLFLNYLQFEMGMSLHLNKLECPSLKDTLCQILLKLAHWFWRGRFSAQVS